jgi:hypothetical protein
LVWARTFAPQDCTQINNIAITVERPNPVTITSH